MSNVMTGIMLGGGALFAAGGALAGGYNQLSKPSEGPPIVEYPDPRSALLVIDVQEDLTGKTAHRTSPYAKDGETFVTRINSLIESARLRNMPVVFSKLEFAGLWKRAISVAFYGNSLIKGSPGAELDERLIINSYPVFPKGKWDAFSNPDLDGFLIKHQVNQLYITGIDAQFCVKATALSALNRNYKVNIINDAVLLGEPDKKDDLLDSFRQAGITLLNSRDFLNPGFRY